MRASFEQRTCRQYREAFRANRRHTKVSETPSRPSPPLLGLFRPCAPLSIHIHARNRIHTHAHTRTRTHTHTHTHTHTLNEVCLCVCVSECVACMGRGQRRGHVAGLSELTSPVETVPTQNPRCASCLPLCSFVPLFLCSTSHAPLFSRTPNAWSACFKLRASPSRPLSCLSPAPSRTRCLSLARASRLLIRSPHCRWACRNQLPPTTPTTRGRSPSCSHSCGTTTGSAVVAGEEEKRARAAASRLCLPSPRLPSPRLPSLHHQVGGGVGGAVETAYWRLLEVRNRLVLPRMRCSQGEQRVVVERGRREEGCRAWGSSTTFLLPTRGTTLSSLCRCGAGCLKLLTLELLTLKLLTRTNTLPAFSWSIYCSSDGEGTEAAEGKSAGSLAASGLRRPDALPAPGHARPQR